MGEGMDNRVVLAERRDEYEARMREKYEDDNRVSAACVGCGRLAYDDDYWARMPDGEILYWIDLCIHEYEPGGLVTCDCGMACPYCQTLAERDAQRKSGEWGLSNSSTLAPKGFKGVLLVPEATGPAAESPGQ